MKTLQKNFTTPEQSKRLLELGLPADSADCFIGNAMTDNEDYTVFVLNRGELYHNRIDDIIADFHYARKEHYLPCWSAGRLIEIHDMCVCDLNTQYGWAMAGNYDYVNYIISRFEDDIMDFSKLED